MFKIDASQIPALVAKIGDLAQNQIPFATSQAINSVAFMVRNAERAEMSRVFDRPIPWLLSTIYVEKGTKANPTATIGPTDYFKTSRSQAGVGVWEGIIAPHVYGGTRLFKAMEMRLKRAGILPAGWFVVPGNDMPRDNYGNAKGSEVEKILSWLGAAEQTSGYTANRNRQSKRLNATRREGAYYFAEIPGRQVNKRLPPGIYKGFAKRASGSIQLMLLFVSSVKYRVRFDWYGIAQRVVRTNYSNEFKSAMIKAIASAK